MAGSSTALRILRNETRSLLARIDRMESFTLHTPMVPAAAIPLKAQVAVERHLVLGKRKLRAMVAAYLNWLDTPEGQMGHPSLAQRRFAFLRLRFIAVLSQVDIFADVLNQRSEHDTGVWLSGLDVFAADALELPGRYYDAPPVICFLERGAGAAIRRARTRLPGGESNPVAVIQVPRERMIGSGIASSLVHEVGHQAAALLDLVGSLRPELRKMAGNAGPEKMAWNCWERWISEIVADLWAVAKLGISATVGLMAVVSLPKAFVFRLDLEDPHPTPWIRIKLSCAMGKALYPHPQWDALAKTWETFYPADGLDDRRREIFAGIEATMPQFIRLLLDHHPGKLRGKSLHEAIANGDRNPTVLAALYNSWIRSPRLMRSAPPSLAFAVIGQAKTDGTLTSDRESGILADLLRHWAFRITLDTTSNCASRPVTVGLHGGRFSGTAYY